MKRSGLFSTPSGKRVNGAFKSPICNPITEKKTDDPDVKDSPNLVNTPKSNTPSNLVSKFRTGHYSTTHSEQVRIKDNNNSASTSIHTPIRSRNPISRIRGGNSFKSPIIKKQITAEKINKNSQLVKGNFDQKSILSGTNTLESTREELKELLEQEKNLDIEISKLENKGYSLGELKSHIENLHDYNDLKDTAQMLMGRLAEIEEDSIKAMHIKYGVEHL